MTIAHQLTRPDPMAKLTRMDLAADQCLSALLKGHSGTAKTESLLSFPDPILLIYADANRATVRAAALRGRRVQVVLVQSWSEYQDIIVPTVKRRAVSVDGQPPRTIGVDTIDFLSDHMWRDIQGSRPKLAIQDFGTGLNRLSDTTRDLVGCTQPLGEHPGYHVVFACHLKDQTNEDGALLRVVPAIMGQFANQLEDYFDYSLLCRAETISRIVDQRAHKERQFKLLSVSPDPFNTAKGSSVLPPEVIVPNGGSAFEELNRYWKIQTGVETPKPPKEAA